VRRPQLLQISSQGGLLVGIKRRFNPGRQLSLPPRLNERWIGWPWPEFFTLPTFGTEEPMTNDRPLLSVRLAVPYVRSSALSSQSADQRSASAAARSAVRCMLLLAVLWINVWS